MTRRRTLSIFPTLLGLLLAACTPAPPPDKRHELRGEVVRLNEADKVAVIKHEEIKDFMEAMTMGFPVPEASEWAKLKPGMKIRGAVVEKKDDFYLTAIQEEK